MESRKHSVTGDPAELVQSDVVLGPHSFEATDRFPTSGGATLEVNLSR